MKKMMSMLLALVLLVVGLAGCGGQETPEEEDVGALGIGRASFWPFHDGILSPLGLDEFFFTILAENVTAGSGSLEIRRQDNDEVLISIPVDEFEYTQIMYEHSNGETEPATQLHILMDDGMMEPMGIYLYVPEGAFMAGDKASKEINDKEQYATIIADCGYYDYRIDPKLPVGTTRTYKLIVGSASSIVLEVEGDAVTAELEMMGETALVTVTAVKPGEAIVYGVFLDAEGNELTAGMYTFICE